VRSDQECEEAVIARNLAALQGMPGSELVGYVRIQPRVVDCMIWCTYLGIMTEEPMRLAEGGTLADVVAARLWQPKSAEEVEVVRAPLIVRMELFKEKTGAPSLHIGPGPYPAVCHPHVEPLLPGYICLTTDWQAETMTLATVCHSLVAMLRFDAGLWSSAPGRPVCPGIAEWLEGPGAEAFELPLPAPQAAHPGIRLLDPAPQEATP